MLAADAIESPAMRQAGPGLLSLALMDARNHTLQLLTLHEQDEDQQYLRTVKGDEFGRLSLQEDEEEEE